MNSRVPFIIMLSTVVLCGCQQSGQAEWSSLRRRSPDASATMPAPADPAAASSQSRTQARAEVPEPIQLSPQVEALPDTMAAGVRPHVATAVSVLEQAISADYAQLRANAIEAAHPVPELAREFAQRGLADENRGVRFVAAMTVGRLKLCGISHLAEPLLLDEHQSVQAAAIFALRTCGQQVDLNPLAEMLRSGDPEVRANAGMVLGLLGDASAAPMIEQAVGREMRLADRARARAVDLQLAESLFLLGRQEQIDTIRARLYEPPESQELSAMAAVIIGRVGDRGSIGSLQRLILADGDERRSAEVRMAAAMSLAELGEAVSPEVVLPFVRSSHWQLRQQAALALGRIGGSGAAEALDRLLHDDNPLVQVAAAGSLLKLDEGSRSLGQR